MCTIISIVLHLRCIENGQRQRRRSSGSKNHCNLTTLFRSNTIIYVDIRCFRSPFCSTRCAKSSKRLKTTCCCVKRARKAALNCRRRWHRACIMLVAACGLRLTRRLVLRKIQRRILALVDRYGLIVVEQ